MPYRFTFFDEVALPRAMPEDDLSTGTVETSLRDSIGGVFDYFGANRRLPRRHEFPHRGKYTKGSGEVQVRVTDTGDIRVTDTGDRRVLGINILADLQVQTDALKGKIGVRGTLWRERLHDGILHWKAARLLHVDHVETVEEANAVSEVQSTFETRMMGWRVEDATVTEVSASDGVGTGMSIANAGTLPVEDAVLRVEATSGTITQVRVVGAGIDWTWSGSIATGQVLTIDAGPPTVTLDGADAYSGFDLGAGHSADTWLPLATGTTLLTVTVTGGSGDVSITHYNQFS